MAEEKEIKDTNNTEEVTKETKDEAAQQGAPSEDQQNDEDSSKGNDLNQLEIELAEMKDKYLRLYSEFENYRRRTAKERLELIKTASKDIITDLLSVVDDFERAEKANDENTSREDLINGFQLIHHKMVKVLREKGLKRIDVKAGDNFDSDYHEAVTQIPAPEDKLKGKIVDVIENGYQIEEKVIRFAKVVTGS